MVTSYLHQLRPRDVCVVVTIISTLVTFLPLLMDQQFAEAQLFASVELSNGKVFHAALIATFFTSLPMALDTLMDFQLQLRITIPRHLIVISLALPGVLTYLAHLSTDSSGTERFAFVSLLAREILLRGSLLSFILCDNCSWKTTCTVACVWIMTMFSLHTFLWRPFRPDVVSYLWNTLGRAMSLSSAIIVGAMILHRWRKVANVSSKSKYEAAYATLYPSLFTLNIILKYILLLTTNDMGNSGFSDVLICIIATTIPGRQARHEKTIAEHIIESKRDYVSYMSHEIRTPLNAVYMGIQLLAKECANGITAVDDVLGILDDIDTSCKVAIDILNEFLLANKLEAGNVTLEKETISAANMIKEVAEPFGVQARQKEVTYTCSGDTHIDTALVFGNVHINVDTRKIRAPVLQPANSAVSITVSHSIHPLVTAFSGSKSVATVSRAAWDQRKNTDVPRLYESDRVLRIEVHDTGVGISPENQCKLFGEVVQFNAAELQNGGGSGIGLWISKKIVDLHGGRIGVTSEPGKGSMFFIELDVAPPNQPTIMSPRMASVTQENCRLDARQKLPRNLLVKLDSAVVRSMKVLVVDDSAVNRKMLTRLMEPRVGHISQAENGLEAVNKVQDSMQVGSHFDLIFMDSTMPEMCGADATIRIRDMGYEGTIVFLTGNVTPEDIDQFLASGANDVIKKPCTLDTIEKVLTAILAEKIWHPTDTSGGKVLPSDAVDREL